MKSYVIDANIFIKQFLDEPDSEQATRFLTFCVTEKFRCHVPSMFFYEVFSVLNKKGLNHDFVKTALEYQGEALLQVTDFNYELSQKACEITKIGHNKSGFPTFYDSFYHALAILNDCDFITADRKHFEKTKKLGHIQLLNDLAL